MKKTIQVNEILKELIELTSQRDSDTLEISLAQTLFDLAAPGAVVIYRAIDIENKRFKARLLNGDIEDHGISSAMKNGLHECFMSGDPFSFRQLESVQEDITFLYPIKGIKDRVVAVMAIVQPAGDNHEFKTNIEMLFQIYHNFVSLIHENERDTLTGLLNRKTFDIKINKILSTMHSAQQRRDDKKNKNYFLAIFDIDHFKKVNDSFGHLIGDEVLLLFSQMMSTSFRSKDHLFRFGGEEFVGLYECLNEETMYLLLDKFRERISLFSFPQVGKVTVSIGFTLMTENDVSTHLIDRADLALYHAKHNGRNQVFCHDKLIRTGVLKNMESYGDVELF